MLRWRMKKIVIKSNFNKIAYANHKHRLHEICALQRKQPDVDESRYYELPLQEKSRFLYFCSFSTCRFPIYARVLHDTSHIHELTVWITYRYLHKKITNIS